MQPSLTPPPTNSEGPFHPPFSITNTTPAPNQGDVSRDNFDAPEGQGEAAWGVDWRPLPEMREEYHAGGPLYEAPNEIRFQCNHPQQIETMQGIYRTERNEWSAHMHSCAAEIFRLRYNLDQANGANNFHKKELSSCTRRLGNASAAKETQGIVITALELALKQLGGDPVAVKKKCLADRPPSKVVTTESKKRKRKSTDGEADIDLVAGPLGKRQKGSSVGGDMRVLTCYPPGSEEE